MMRAQLQMLTAAVLFVLFGIAAAWAAEPADLVAESGITGGLVVHVGCGDGIETVALQANDRFLVQGLDTDGAAVTTARHHIRSLGKYGRVAVDTFDGRHLPYTDNLVNLLVVSRSFAVDRAEMLRVLAPGGAAHIAKDGQWSTIVKPRPDNIDDWTHYLHGPDNNAVAADTMVGPPRHLQWVAGPRWTRTHHKLNTISSIVTASGRVFYIADEATASNLGVPGKWVIAARDAFNGLPLWKKPINKWVSGQTRFRSGPAQVTRLLVADGPRVFAPLGLNAPISVLDAATGETMATYEDTAGAEEMVLANDVLLVLKADVAVHARAHPDFRGGAGTQNPKTIVAVDTANGQTLWSWSEPGFLPAPETLATDGERVFVQVGRGVVCLDGKTGEKTWTHGTATAGKIRNGFGVNVLVVSQGVVLCDLGGTLTALKAANGDQLWSCPGGMGFHAPPDVFVINGLVWTGVHPQDSVAPPPVHDFSVARDLHTGEVKRTNEIMVDLQTAGHHHRCYRNKATTRYIASGKRGIEMLDLHADNHSRNNWLRGTCQYGILPANGLIYAPPHSCGCYMESKLSGFYALSASRSVTARDDVPLPSDQRLEKGPAYGTRVAAADYVNAWPQYRHDPLRTGAADSELPAALSQKWKRQIGGKLTQPTIAGGKVVLASVDENTIYALDAATGQPVWQCVVGGRVDSPPTIHNGLVLFGCADGWVYCHRLDDGKLVWRFFAAPDDLRSVACGQVESLWPVHGSVLVLNDVAYCCAGRSSWLDGGMVLYGLEPATGRVICGQELTSEHPEFRQGADLAKKEHDAKISQNVTDYRTFLQSDRSDSFSMSGGVINDVLGSDGRNVFLHHMCINTRLEPQPLARHLFSTSGFLDDTENHRSHWVLGSGDFSRIPVAYSWIANGASPTGLAAPFGLMLVFDSDSVWGIRRRGQSASYTVFERANTPFAADETPSPDLRKIPKNEVKPPRWTASLAGRPRAMLKSGDRLYFGCAPTHLIDGDPHAAYEGRVGGTIRVLAAVGGEQVAEYKLPAPAVWDGMAAANRHLFVSTTAGELICLGGE